MELGYYLYMEDEERKQKEKEEVNVADPYGLVQGMTTTQEKKENDKFFPERQRPQEESGIKLQPAARSEKKQSLYSPSLKEKAMQTLFLYPSTLKTT